MVRFGTLWYGMLCFSEVCSGMVQFASMVQFDSMVQFGSTVLTPRCNLCAQRCDVSGLAPPGQSTKVHQAALRKPLDRFMDFCSF